MRTGRWRRGAGSRHGRSRPGRTTASTAAEVARRRARSARPRRRGRSTASTTSCSQLLPGNSTTPTRRGHRRPPRAVTSGVLDDRVGQEAAHRLDLPAGRLLASASIEKRIALPARTPLTGRTRARAGTVRWWRPAGRRCPGRSATSTSTSVSGSRRAPRRPSRSHPVEPLGRRSSIPGAGGLDHVVGQRRRGRCLVPPCRLQPVPQRLLVERRRRGPRLPLVGGPEPRRVGRQHLVADGQLPVDKARARTWCRR